ncbi:MAG: hypothetical protein IJ842_03530 [Bacilli bacterium]|nr:hypothetical protein [Bacilli bacterium]
MYKDTFEFCTKGEIKNLLLSGEKLVYADNGIDEFVVRYNDLPDFIVDMSRSMGNRCELKVYKYPAESMTPILTTIGEFLDRCDHDVRADIIDRLVAVQTEVDTKSYRIINEYDLEVVKEDIDKNISVKILNLWLSDYGDIRCNASISVNGKEKANIITSFERDYYPDWKNSQNDYKEEIKDEWEKYLHLPKISKCSKLMQEIYDNVCESEATMCHITNDDWKELYADRFTNKDITKLKEEVKKYKLDDVITFDDREYKIIGWGNLETSFNDDRKLERNKEMER